MIPIVPFKKSIGLILSEVLLPRRVWDRPLPLRSSMRPSIGFMQRDGRRRRISLFFFFSFFLFSFLFSFFYSGMDERRCLFSDFCMSGWVGQ